MDDAAWGENGSLTRRQPDPENGGKEWLCGSLDECVNGLGLVEVS